MKGRRRPARAKLLFALAVLGALVTAAVAQSGGAAKEQRFAGTIKFGVAISQTGPLSAEGKTAKNGYDFAVQHINRIGGIPVGKKKYRVQIVYYDDQSNANLSVQQYEKLINEDKVNFLLGPYSSGVTLATSTVAEKYKIPMVVAHAATPAVYERGYKYLFGVLNVIDQYTAPLFEMASKLNNPKPQRVAIMHENALAPTAFANSAANFARQKGMQVVYQQAFPQGADFAPILRAAVESKPDIVLTGGYSLGMVSLVRQAAEQRANFPLWMFLLGPTVPGFLDSVGRAGEYLLEPIQWAANFNPTLKDEIFGWNARQFSKQFLKDKGYYPDYHPPQSAAALEVYFKAIKTAGTLNRQKVRDAIAKIRLRSFYGNVCFNAKGQEACKSMGIAQIQGGRPAVVYPSQFATRKLIYPAPKFG